MPGNKSVNLKLYDIHCHILPGVDDGSRSMEESLAMLGMEYDEGVRFILLTPHFRYDMFETGLETIKKRFQELQQQSKEKWPDLTLRLGCELHRSMDMVECLKDGRRLALNGTRYVLLEFSGRDPRSMIFERTKDLLDHGYRPIVAHVERYPVLRESELVLEQIPAVTWCNSCKSEYETVRYGKECPYCHSGETWLLQGNECVIKEIEAE